MAHTRPETTHGDYDDHEPGVPAAAAATAAADTAPGASVTAPAHGPAPDAAGAVTDTAGSEEKPPKKGRPRPVRGSDANIIKPHRNAMRRRYDLFAKRLEAYLSSPGEETLHDLRTSIRRFESTYGALPKSERPARCGRLMSAAKDLFRRTGPLRDSDVISYMLIELGAPADSEAVVKLCRGREGALEDALFCARKIAALKPLPGAVDKIDRHKMASKRRRMIWSLFDDVRSISVTVTSDESNVEELHAMRKMVKRLRYLLEDETQYRMYCRAAAAPAPAGTGAAASPGNGTGSSVGAAQDSDASLSRVLDSVRQVQESTGTIHDCDIALQYVTANYVGLGDGAAGIFDAIQKRRHKTYLDLVGAHGDNAPSALHPKAEPS
ncbi:MAG: CHAD domain-containing protein [Nitrosopumilaceae archaeon]|nr:CHAD domain-containing protein [Nitrosopumilaceae archaeon]